MALLPGDLHEIEFGQAGRFHQGRPGDGDIVVPGQLLDDGGRCIANRRQALGQFGARLGSDLGDQPRQDVVEQTDVVLVEIRGAIQKVRREALSAFTRRSGEPCSTTSSSSGINEV